MNKIHESWMNLALIEASKAFRNKEIPIGAIIVKDNKVIINLLRPNSYYNEKYELIEPEVIIKYILKDGQTRVLNVPIDNKIPYRNLLQTKYKSKETKIETQEKILLRNQYPDILI